VARLAARAGLLIAYHLFSLPPGLPLQ